MRLAHDAQVMPVMSRSTSRPGTANPCADAEELFSPEAPDEAVARSRVSAGVDMIIPSFL